MTMHLLPPMYSTTGRKRGKTKYRSAEAKRQAEQLEREWAALKARHGATDNKRKVAPAAVRLPTQGTTHTRTNQTVPSLRSWDTGAATVKQSQQYTGTKILGIGTMHKSNAVPIFTNEEAESIASMRR
jgi:hypothetical protein